MNEFRVTSFGNPKHFQSLEVDDMQAPDSIVKVAGFIAIKQTYGSQGMHPYDTIGGTLCVVNIEVEALSHPIKVPYLVTAKHNIDDAVKASVDGKIYVIFNNEDGDIDYFPTTAKEWLNHPTQPKSVDACARLFEEFSRFDFRPISSEIFCKDEDFIVNEELDIAEIGLGNDVLAIGLFAKFSGRTNIHPIVRKGNIAMLPDEQVPSSLGLVDAYIIELRSINGLSGSPVLLFDERNPIQVKDGQKVYQRNARMNFLGLIHGHWDDTIVISDTRESYEKDNYVTDKVNTGMALVVPAPKILEILRQQAFIDKEKIIVGNLDDFSIPVMDSGFGSKN